MSATDRAADDRPPPAAAGTASDLGAGEPATGDAGGVDSAAGTSAPGDPATDRPQGGDKLEDGDDFPQSEEQRYFHAIEDRFIELRGAPLYLSSSDWQVARRWHELGIPLEVVVSGLETVFARREERKAKRRLASLRYCAPAVEQAWEEIRELTAAGRTTEVAPLEAAPRLAALAAALPGELPRRAEWIERIASLTGSTERVEQQLADLDDALLDDLEQALDEGERRQLDEMVAASLTHLATRLEDKELKRARHRLRRQALRERRHLPVLSLFSPEAELAEAAEADDDG
jgi:hypothetical protein